MVSEATSYIEVEVPSLKSRLIGLREAGLASFRGIPYASISQRWQHSQPITTLHSPFEATKYGARCPQPQRGSLVSYDLPDPVVADDEFNCLHVNVTAPISALEAGRKGPKSLPVMVWIHGGAFNFGYNSTSRFKPDEFCLKAIEAGQPVVVVSIGYRLGVLGFASSIDLDAEMKKNQVNGTEQSGKDFSAVSGNFGLLDQRNALSWIGENIRAFGGDPQNITAFGVSAGSMSIHAHILTGDPLFDRAIMMSGTAGTLGPLPVDQYREVWEDFVRKSSISPSEDPAERLASLRAIDVNTTIKNYFTRRAIGPSADGQLQPLKWSHRQPQNSTRCKSVIIGDTQCEAIILNGLIRKFPEAQIAAMASEYFSPEDATAFLKVFGFSPGNCGREAFEDSLRKFLSIMMFQFPAQLVAETYPGDVYYYHFDEPSPYKGPTYGIPFHGQDAAFIYQNGCDRYAPTGRKLAKEMGNTFVDFAYGKPPWPAFNQTNDWKYKRWGPGGRSGMYGHEDDETRNYEHQTWLRAHFEDTMMLSRSIIAMDWGQP